MAAIALAQEKVWFNKAIYDKAACLHFERIAKVVADNIVEQQCEPSPKCLVNDVVSQDPPITNEQTTNSSKKSKDKNNKAAKKNRNMKKSKSDVIETKEQTTVQQESHLKQNTCKWNETETQQNPIIPATGSLAKEIAKARKHIKRSLQCMNDVAAASTDSFRQGIVEHVAVLEKDVQELRTTVDELKGIVKALQAKLDANSWPSLQICPAKPAEKPAADNVAGQSGSEDDVDLFGSESEGEDAEAAKIREERVAAYAAKKSKKPALIAKSNIILDVKPWDDETDMKVMEKEVRKIQCDGLLWGAAKLVPLAFGIHKLQISCVVEDEKVSVDWLTEKIQELEDYVQSVDIAAFNKV